MQKLYSRNIFYWCCRINLELFHCSLDNCIELKVVVLKMWRVYILFYRFVGQFAFYVSAQVLILCLEIKTIATIPIILKKSYI